MMDETIKKIDYPEEYRDIFKVLDAGAKKYGANTWLNPDRTQSKFDVNSNFDHIFHHLARAYIDPLSKDEEMQCEHLLMVANRAMMAYTVLKRGLE